MDPEQDFIALRETIVEGLDEIENSLRLQAEQIEIIANNEAETARAHNALTRSVGKAIKSMQQRLSMLEGK